MVKRMKRFKLIFHSALAICAIFSSVATAAEFVSIFDGKSLAGWDGDPRLWRVEDGAIVGETTAELTTKHNTFLIWKAATLPTLN